MPGGRRPSLLGVVSAPTPHLFSSLSRAVSSRAVSKLTRVMLTIGGGRDAHAANNKYALVWVVCQLLFSIVSELQKVGVLEVEVNSFERCVNLGLDYVANPEADFASLHPCPRAGPPLSGASPTSHNPTVPSHTSSQPL